MPTERIRSSRLGALGALRILRAPQWVHFLALPAAGLDRAAFATSGGLMRLAIAVAAAASALGYAYGINAIADRASDAPGSKNPLAGAGDLPPEAALTVLLAAGCAIACGAALGVRSLAFLAGSLVFGTIYSAGPRFKAVPFLGLALNTLIFAPLLAIAASPTKAGALPTSGALLVAFVALILQNQLLHEAADADEDARGGAMTTARLLGPRLTRAVVPAIAAPFAALAVALANNMQAAIAAAAAIAAGSAAAIFVRDPGQARRAHRWAAAIGGAALFFAGLMP